MIETDDMYLQLQWILFGFETTQRGFAKSKNEYIILFETTNMFKCKTMARAIFISTNTDVDTFRLPNIIWHMTVNFVWFQWCTCIVCFVDLWIFVFVNIVNIQCKENEKIEKMWSKFN